MAINIKGMSTPKKDDATNLDNLGNSAPPQAATEAPQEPPPETGGDTPQDQPKAPPATAPGHQSGASFLMQGDQQRSQIDQVKAIQELRAKLRTGVREFWLNPGEFAKLYFLDGKLLSDNVFDTPMISTHFLQIAGNWTRFVCNNHTEGQCIVCNSNSDGSQPQTLQLFTVINIMPWTIQNGPKKGQVLPARLQMFAATMKVREKLMKRAQNRGGALAGSIYQFSRSSKQDPRTGDDIEFIQEVPMQSVLSKYPMLGTNYDPNKKEYVDAPTKVYDYAKVYPVITNEELAQLRPDIASMAGFTAYTPMANAAPPSGFGADPTAAMDDEVPF